MTKLNVLEKQIINASATLLASWRHHDRYTNSPTFMEKTFDTDQLDVATRLWRKVKQQRSELEALIEVYQTAMDAQEEAATGSKGA